MKEILNEKINEKVEEIANTLFRYFEGRIEFTQEDRVVVTSSILASYVLGFHESRALLLLENLSTAVNQKNIQEQIKAKLEDLKTESNPKPKNKEKVN